MQKKSFLNEFYYKLTSIFLLFSLGLNILSLLFYHDIFNSKNVLTKVLGEKEVSNLREEELLQSEGIFDHKLVIEKNKINMERDLIIFYDRGEMNKQALSFVNTISYPVKRLDYSELENKKFLEFLKQEYKNSAGLSNNFEYLPVIFVQGKIFSGFNWEIRSEIENIIY